MSRLVMSAIVASALLLSFVAVRWPSAAVAESPASENEQSLSLMTANPEEGFALAITLSRKAVTEIQPDTDVLHATRPAYAHDPEALISASHVVAVHFQTVAAANDYWRESSKR